MPQVSLTHCHSYNPAEVEEALDLAIGRLGGMERFVRPGMRVVLKVNMVMPMHPATSTVTHPEVVAQVARLVKAAGGVPVLGDSPALQSSDKGLEASALACGYMEIAEREGIEFITHITRTEVQVKNGYRVSSFPAAEEFVNADAIINIAKAKTHTFTVFSGAVKNSFGVIPGLSKPPYHAKFPRKEQFAEFLLDVTATVKPVLHVIDGIVGMEGPGPSSGYPTPLGMLGLSTDPHALDLVTAHLMGLPIEEVTTLAAGRRHGLLPEGGLEQIDLFGEDLAAYLPARPFMPAVMPKNKIVKYVNRGVQMIVPRRARQAMRSRPAVDAQKCKVCGNCVRICPMKVITIVDSLPKIDPQPCIRCYCCHEMCPHKAIDVFKPGFLGIGGERIVRENQTQK